MKRIYYHVTGKKLLAIFKEEWEKKLKLQNKIGRFAKKHGFESKHFFVNQGDGMYLTGLYRKKDQEINKTLWTNYNSPEGTYRPKSNTKEGRVIKKEWDELKWSHKPLMDAVEWKGFHYKRDGNGYFAMFNMFVKVDHDIFGFVAPDVKENEYVPVKGITIRKPSWYAKHFED